MFLTVGCLFAQLPGGSGTSCSLVPQGKASVFVSSALLTSVSTVPASSSPRSSFLFFNDDCFSSHCLSGCFPLLSTQLKAQLEQTEMLVEKEQVLRQKLSLELEEVGAGKEDSRALQSLQESLVANKAQEINLKKLS